MVNHPNRSKRPKWQPIETAPEDLPILICENGAMIVASYLQLGATRIWSPADIGGYNMEFGNAPTHWMPLPPPPVSSQDGEGG